MEVPRRLFLKNALLLTGGVLVLGRNSLVQAETSMKYTDLVGEFPVPRKKANIVLQNLADNTVLVDNKTKNTFVVNDTALLIWNNIDGILTSYDLAQLLTKKFQISVGRARCDTTALLRLFEREGMIEMGEIAHVYSKKIKS